MDPQPHPLLHLLIRMNDVHECLSSGGQKCGSHKGKDLGCTEDVQVFPSQISEAYPSPDWQYGDRRYHAKGCLRPTAFQGVLTLRRVPAPSATKKRTTALLCLPPFPMLDEHTLHYAHLQSNKEITCGPLRFHHACLLPNRWQFRYTITVMPAFARNVIYGGCSVFIWLPLYIGILSAKTA